MTSGRHWVLECAGQGTDKHIQRDFGNLNRKIGSVTANLESDIDFDPSEKTEQPAWGVYWR